PAARSRLHVAVAQLADALDAELDDAARLREAPEFVAAAVAHRAGPEELAGVQGFAARHVGDDVLEAVVHGGRTALRPELAVDAGFHPQRVRIGDLVGGDDARAEHVAGVEILALGRAHHAGALRRLHVARRHVVHDR